jgi:putative flippase GtrA
MSQLEPASDRTSKARIGGQAMRYVIVAGAGFVFAIVSYAIALELGIDPYLAIVLIFILNGLFNFVGTRLWAFPPSGGHPAGELARFCVVALGTLAINYGSFALLYEVLDLDALLAQVLAIMIAAPFGFLANRIWTFRASRSAVEARSATTELG